MYYGHVGFQFQISENIPIFPLVTSPPNLIDFDVSCISPSIPRLRCGLRGRLPGPRRATAQRSCGAWITGGGCWPSTWRRMLGRGWRRMRGWNFSRENVRNLGIEMIEVIEIIGRCSDWLYCLVILSWWKMMIVDLIDLDDWLVGWLVDVVILWWWMWPICSRIFWRLTDSVFFVARWLISKWLVPPIFSWDNWIWNIGILTS